MEVIRVVGGRCMKIRGLSTWLSTSVVGPSGIINYTFLLLYMCGYLFYLLMGYFRWYGILKIMELN
jgi:hypothetical protein